MRLVARLIVGVLAVLALTAAGLYLLRKPIAKAAVEAVMANAGLERPSVVVENVTASQLSLSEIHAGAGGALALQNVEFRYDWRELIFRRKVRSVAIASGTAAASIDPQGLFSLAGWRPNRDAPPAPPPFEQISIKEIAVDIETHRGRVKIKLVGDFDYASGGRFGVVVEAPAAGIAAVGISNLEGSGDVALGADGAIAATGGLKGDVEIPLGAVRGADIAFVADLKSWRTLFSGEPRSLLGDARITIRSSVIEAEDTPALSNLSSKTAAKISRISASGEIAAALMQDGVSVSLSNKPFVIETDRGDRVVLAGEDPVYAEDRGAKSVFLQAAITGPAVEGALVLRARAEKDATWSVKAETELEAPAISGFSFEKFKASFDGMVTAGSASGTAAVDTIMKSGEIGRLRVFDAPLATKFGLDVDFAERRISASPAEGDCFRSGRANFGFVDQDMDLKISDAMLCPTASPLVVINWGAGANMIIDGRLDADVAHFRIGQTNFDGAPPRIDFTLNYDPAAETSRIRGAMAGGSFALNDALILTRTLGVFESALVRDRISAKATLTSARIAQKAETEQVAPVVISGVAILDDDVATFDFNVKSTNGASLGEGEGVHYVKSGDGQAVFDSGVLKFAYGLQPDRLIPALRGVISNASGSAEGRAQFTWSSGEISSAATINLDNVSFGGPGVAVTRTEGVSGKLVFSSLSPVATAGDQSISIRKIDLDSLKLENGEMRFRMPGDDTLEIVEAEFPWFDGAIGAYNSKMTLAGGATQTQLQIDNVNLGQLLGYLNVDGLSGEGVIEGVLPISFDGGRARVNNGILSSKGVGVVRYQGKATAAAAKSNEQSALAFEILRELRFEKLSAIIDGPLDGTLNFKILFDGRSDIPVKTGKETQRVDSPVKYRITIDAPLLSLIEQAVLSTNVKLQIERAQKAEEAGAAQQ
jgi:hypothetical protein